MRSVIIMGVLLMLAGGGLMALGVYRDRNKHEANVFGARISVTETDRKKIPVAVSATLLVVGAALTLIGAVKSKAK